MGTQGTGWSWMSPLRRTSSPQGWRRRRRRRRGPDPGCLPHAPSLLQSRWHRTWTRRRGHSLGFTRVFPRPPRARGSPGEGGDRPLLGGDVPAVREGRFAESPSFLGGSGQRHAAPQPAEPLHVSPARRLLRFFAARVYQQLVLGAVGRSYSLQGGGGKKKKKKEAKTAKPDQTPVFLSLLSPAADVSSSSCSPVRPRYVDAFS